MEKFDDDAKKKKKMMDIGRERFVEIEGTSFPCNASHVLIAINASPASERMRFSVHRGRSTTITSYARCSEKRKRDSNHCFERSNFPSEISKTFDSAPQDKLFLLSIVRKISRYILNYRLSEPVTWKKIDIKKEI